MPNIQDAFPGKFLKAADLQGRDITVVMDRVEFEPVGQDRKMKAVLYFQGKDKGLVLNKTNANKITEITGSALTEEWRGHRIRIYPTETQFGGDMVDCIRVKPANGPAFRMSKPAPRPVEPEHDLDDHSGPLDESDIPFAWLMPFVLPALGLLSAIVRA